LLVYDVTNRASFEHAEDWLKDVREHADPNLTAILVANKLDLVADEDEVFNASAGDAARASLDVPNGEAASRKSLEGASTIGRRGKRRREVGKEEAENWAKEHSQSFILISNAELILWRVDILFIEASAKTGVNVDAAFDQAARDILRKIKEGVYDDGSVSPIALARWPMM